MSSTLLMKEGGRGDRGSRMVMISKMTMMIVAIINNEQHHDHGDEQGHDDEQGQEVQS